MNTVAVQIPASARLKGWTMWASWFCTAVAIAIFVWSAYAKLTHMPTYVREWERLGYPESILTGMGFVQLTCLALYLIPRTAVLGVVLLSGYMGGAMASYTRIGEPHYAVPFELVTILFAWGGIYFREERLWSLLPFRRKAAR
jgi:hypothetical protein